MVQDYLLRSLSAMEELPVLCHVILDGSPISCPYNHYIHYDSMKGFYNADTIRTGTHAICNERSIRDAISRCSESQMG